jgi:hypothetical protein
VKLYFVTVVLVDGCNREYAFSMTIPATSEQAAKDAAADIGFAINDSTNHMLKVRNSEIEVTNTGRIIPAGEQ